MTTLTDMPIWQLWDLNTAQRGGSFPQDVKETGAELMRRTDTSPEACKKANRRQAEYRAKMAQKAKEADK